MASSIITLKARLLLFDRGNLLLIKQTKPNGGNYSLVGGTIERNEFAIESLIRESREEAGIILQPEDLRLAHVIHKRRDKEQRITLYFKANKWSGKLKALETHKFEKVAWFPLYDLPKKLTSTVRQVLREYRKGNLYSEMFKK